jgi:hypothetical protein
MISKSDAQNRRMHRGQRIPIMPPAADGCSTGIPFWAILLYKAMVVDMTGLLEQTEIDSDKQQPARREIVHSHAPARKSGVLPGKSNE